MRSRASRASVVGLGDEGEGAACEAVLALLVEGDDLHGDVAGGGSCLSWFSTVQPSMSGRKMSSEMAVGRNWLGEGEARRRVGATAP
jgi:hypothetical protein